jgi:hypothetical protein
VGWPSSGLAQYLTLPEGPHPVPSDDTYRRTIARLDPEAFEPG